MATTYEIPLTAEPQSFQIALGGVVYALTVRWNIPASAWCLDVADANGAPILAGIPLVTGCNLLGQYGYLNFGGALVAQTDHDLMAPPAYGNLGTTGHLYFVTP